MKLINVHYPLVSVTQQESSISTYNKYKCHCKPSSTLNQVQNRFQHFVTLDITVCFPKTFWEFYSGSISIVISRILLESRITSQHVNSCGLEIYSLVKNFMTHATRKVPEQYRFKETVQQKVIPSWVKHDSLFTFILNKQWIASFNPV